MSLTYRSGKKHDDALEHFDLTATRRSSLLPPSSLSSTDRAADIKWPPSSGDGALISESAVSAGGPLTSSTPQQSTAPWVSTPETLSQQRQRCSGTKRLWPGRDTSVELIWGEDEDEEEEEEEEQGEEEKKEGEESIASRSERPAPPTIVKRATQDVGPKSPSTALVSRSSIGSPARVSRRLSMPDAGRPTLPSLAARAGSIADTIAEVSPSPVLLSRRDMAAEPATESRLPLPARPGYTMPSPRTPLWAALEEEEEEDGAERARERREEEVVKEEGTGRAGGAEAQRRNKEEEAAERMMNANAWAERTRSFFELIDRRPLIAVTVDTPKQARQRGE